jgi:hypothetical protein
VETANYYKLDKVVIWYHFRFKKNKCALWSCFWREIKSFVNGWYILGEEVKALKTILRVIVERTIALRNGLDALTPFLKAIFN